MQFIVEFLTILWLQMREIALTKTEQEPCHNLDFKLAVKHYSRALHTPFVISRGAKTHADCIVVEVKFLGQTGRGEGVPYARYGETVESCMKELLDLNPQDPHNFSHVPLKAGAARNALDCAFWDLRAKIAKRPVWELANISAPQLLRCTQTLSLASPAIMAEIASKLGDAPLIKIKLGGPDDVDCVRAVRQARPMANIIVDANEGWNIEQYLAIIPQLMEAKVEMIEQPFPAGNDEMLSELERPIPICADESVHTAKDVALLRSKYDMVNIKLDKTGGLTDAIKLKSAARAIGMDYMIGCMVGSSISMAPAMLLGTNAKYVDLDGPLFLSEDVPHGIKFSQGMIHPFTSELWG